MSFALPARQVTFGRSHVPPQQQQAYQQQQPPTHGLALPSAGSNSYYPGSSGLALLGPATASFQLPQPISQSQSQGSQSSQSSLSKDNGAVAGPSTPPATPPPATPVPATPAPLTLEQQHITAVEGIVPTLQNIVATVNLDCRLDLKTIALHARNAEYNPKVGNYCFSSACMSNSRRSSSHSVSQPLSCESATQKQPLLSSRRARWLSLVLSPKMTHG